MRINYIQNQKTWMIAVIGVLIGLNAQAQNYICDPEIDNWSEKLKQNKWKTAKNFWTF